MANEIKYVPKNWGYELWIANNEQYCGKKLHVIKDRYCSVHYHCIKDETFWVERGELTVHFLPTEYAPDKSIAEDLQKCAEMDMFDKNKQALVDAIGDIWNMYKRATVLTAGSKFHIPPHTLHTFRGATDVDMFEFSTQHFDEDSYRIAKSIDL